SSAWRATMWSPGTPRAWPNWASSRPASRRSRRPICGATAAAASSPNGRRRPESLEAASRGQPRQARQADRNPPPGEGPEAVAADEVEQEADHRQGGQEGDDEAEHDEAGVAEVQPVPALEQVIGHGAANGRQG